MRVPATITKTVVRRVNVPGPVSTKTIVRDRQLPAKSVTVTQRVTSGQNAQKSATVPTVTVTTTAQRTDVRVVEKERVVNLTKPGAVGLSLGLIAVGIAITLLVLYIMYRLGYLRAENRNVEDWKDLRDSLKE
jgi:hypothetical protein